MYLKSLELAGFKSFGKKETLDFGASVSAIVGPNGSGKSNIAEAFRFVLGEQSLKSMRGKKGEDLIFNGGSAAARANRAAVKITFNNAPEGGPGRTGKRLFDSVDFDEVIIERAVHRDGVNQYSINGSQVRLRDVLELLARANIGASGHHIISQGEADRILNTSPRERREMIEDALGLKVYQYKLKESERKLEKTKENIAQVEALRKEIAPHMRFLKKQVEKVEKTKALRDDLRTLYREYLKRESVYLSFHTQQVEGMLRAPQEELKELEAKLAQAKAILENEKEEDAESKHIIELEGKLRTLREEKDILARDLGGLEGEIRAEERAQETLARATHFAGEATVPLTEVKELLKEVDEYAKRAEKEETVGALRSMIHSIQHLCSAFLSKKETSQTEQNTITSEHIETLKKLRSEHEAKNKTYQGLETREQDLLKEYQKMQEEIVQVRDKSREAERTVFTIMTRQNELHSIIGECEHRRAELTRTQELFDRELEEGALLAGREVLQFEHVEIIGGSGDVLSQEAIANEKREKQEERRRAIERIKIKIEEFGGGGEEILKEYAEIEERDQFLEREIGDLESSAAQLKTVMKELEETLRTQFKEGISKINKEFEHFFELMFGGGKASLKLVEPQARRSAPLVLEDGLEVEGDMLEEEQKEEGIDISVSLPRKRIRGLVMLSGGERALTSIALLFAMSQVNPPPFLILDETDAALDEANSKRYGDMVENLAKYSQLIVITHNRETMSRASILYGVTMGGDGVSKLLSVKFEDAVKVAK